MQGAKRTLMPVATLRFSCSPPISLMVSLSNHAQHYCHPENSGSERKLMPFNSTTTRNQTATRRLPREWRNNSVRPDQTSDSTAARRFFTSATMPAGERSVAVSVGLAAAAFSSAHAARADGRTTAPRCAACRLGFCSFLGCFRGAFNRLHFRLLLGLALACRIVIIGYFGRSTLDDGLWPAAIDCLMNDTFRPITAVRTFRPITAV